MFVLLQVNFAFVELLLVREVREGTFPKAPLARDPLGMAKGAVGASLFGFGQGDTLAGGQEGRRRVRFESPLS